MTGRTNYTALDNDDEFGFDQINAALAHFDTRTGESVATASALPASGNWVGRTITTADTGTLYLCTTLPGTWKKIGEDTGWQNLTLQNSWVNFGGAYSSARVRRLNGLVSVQGLVANGTISGSVTVATLPAGFRPAGQIMFIVNSSGGPANLDVAADGRIIIANLPSQTYLSLNLPPFPAEG